MAIDIERYDVVQVVTTKDGVMMTREEFEEQREPVAWQEYLSLRAINAIKNTFGSAVDLNDKDYRNWVAKHNWMKVPNCGRNTYKEIMGLIEQFWPWQERHGQGVKPHKRFANVSQTKIDRNKKIFDDRLSGMTLKAIGEKYNLHPATIRVICYRIEKYGDKYLKVHEFDD